MTYSEKLVQSVQHCLESFHFSILIFKVLQSYFWYVLGIVWGLMVESIPLSNAPPFSVSNRLNEMLLEQNRTEHIQWNAPLAAIVLKSPLDLPVVRTSPDHKTFNSPPMDAVRLISQYAHQIKNIHIPDKHRNTKKEI